MIVETIIDYHELSWPFERAFRVLGVFVLETPVARFSFDSLADFSQRRQGLRQRRRTRALLCTLMLWFHGKGVFFRVENFFNFALWMNKIRSPASYTRKLLCLFCREKFCKKTFNSGIELICEFAKIWLIITKTCFDSFLLFLLVWLLCKSFWKAVWRVRVVHQSSFA